MHRIQIEHQPMLIRRHRGQREDLRRRGLLQVEHEANDARLVLADAHAADVRVVRMDLADELAQPRVQFEAFDVDDEARRVFGDEVARRQGGVGLDRHARVVVGRPDPHRDDAGTERDLARAEHEHRGTHRA